MELTSIEHLGQDHRPLLKHITLLDRLEAYLEDLNLEDVEMDVQFHLGSGGRAKGVFHASTLGSKSGKSLCGKYLMGCGRQLYYDYTAAKSEGSWEPRFRRLLDTGTAVHSQLQAYLEEIAARSEGAETFAPEASIDPRTNSVADTLDISGHTDGIYTIDTGEDHIRFGLEIKTINDAGFKKTQSPHPEHLMQGTIYQKCLDLPYMVFLYYNKNDSSMAEFCQVFDELRWNAVVAKIQYVRECTMENRPPAQEVSWNCRTCKYKNICKPHSMSVPRFSRR